ncbi:Protein flp [Halioglobus japonicus]|nr:Protein flp [Halioglobus japonicus]
MSTNDELSLSSAAIEKLRGRLQHAIDKGPLPSLQFALAKDGELVLHETLGSADNSTRYSIFSCTKPVVASAIWRLMGERLMLIDQPVADYIPVFAENGKQHITVEQLLCHTAGFPRAPLSAPAWSTRAGRLNAMRDWRLNWEPGSRMEYHPLSAHWVLAELIECVSGVDYRHYLQANIIAPLGLKQLRLGVPKAEQADIATLQHVGEPPASEQMRELFGAAIAWPNSVDHSLLMFNEPAVRELGVPGGGAVSTAADMALFYQGVMRNSGELWQPEVLADAVGRVRVDFPDPMTGAPANRGLGVVIAGSDHYLPYRGMGNRVSASTFGHQGVGGQVAWGDPVSGISFCLLTNGLDANPLRSAQLCAAASNRAGACWLP